MASRNLWLAITGVARLFCFRAKFHQYFVLRAANFFFALFFFKCDIIGVNLVYFSYKKAELRILNLTQVLQIIFGRAALWPLLGYINIWCHPSAIRDNYRHPWHQDTTDIDDSWINGKLYDDFDEWRHLRLTIILFNILFQFQWQIITFCRLKKFRLL